MSLLRESSRWMAVMAWGRDSDIGFTAALELASSQAQILLPIFYVSLNFFLKANELSCL